MAVALAAHAGMALIVLGMAPPERFETWPDGEAGPTFSVSLVKGDMSPRPVSAVPDAASPMDRMLAELGAGDAAPGAPQSAAGAGEQTSLDSLFGEGGQGGETGRPGGKIANNQEAGAAKPGFDYGAQASVPRRRPGAGGGPAGPCWGRPERPVPVVMAILLDKDGVLIGRPRIIKAGDGPGDPRAADYERTAMRAMAGCAPFSLAPPGIYEAYRIDFSREKGGLIRLGPMASP